jgi:LSD1 subclass zinc finger protein
MKDAGDSALIGQVFLGGSLIQHTEIVYESCRTLLMMRRSSTDISGTVYHSVTAYVIDSSFEVKARRAVLVARRRCGA